MLTEYERELKASNRKQMTELISKWKQEKDKMEGVIREDSVLKAEFDAMFKKYQLY